MRRHISTSQSIVRLALCILSVVGAFLVPCLAQDENESVGFRSTHVFESGNFGENLDTLNGGITLTTPIGPPFKVTSTFDYGLALHYSSKVWDSAHYSNGLNVVGELVNQVVPTRKGPFGMGFAMHFGRIYQKYQLQENATYKNYAPPLTSTWIWEDPSGTPHEFFADPNVNPNCVDPDPYLGPGVSIPAPACDVQSVPHPSTTFTNRLTNDLSYTRISGPDTQYCKPSATDNGTTDDTNCFRVETPDGRVYTLAKRVDCTPPPSDRSTQAALDNFLLHYQEVRSDNESYCGWYTTLIEDPSVGSSPFPNYVRVAYDQRTNFEHLISRVYDSTWNAATQVGRQILFQNCEVKKATEGNNPYTDNVDDMCKSGTRSDLASPAGSGPASSRRGAATFKVEMPAPGGSTSFNTSARASYSFFYEFAPVKQAHDYYESNPPADCVTYKCTPVVTDPVMKLVRIDYPPALRVGQAVPDQYSLYYGYYNSYTAEALALSFGGNGDYGEVTCRTLPVLRKQGGTSLITGNGCTSATGDWPVFKYQYGYYFHIKAYLNTGHAAMGEKKGTAGGGYAFSATGLSRHVVIKTLEQPINTPPTRSWAYHREAAQFSNPFSVTVTDPFHNDTVYYYHASASSTNPDITGEDPEDGYAPEWSDGLNERIEYFRGTGPTRTLVRTQLEEHDSDLWTNPLGHLMHSNANIRSKRSVTQYNDDGNVESTVTRQQWDGIGHWKVEIESGFEVSTPRTTRTIYQGAGSGMPGAQCTDTWTSTGPLVYRTDLVSLKEVSDGKQVLSRLEQQFDARGNLVTSIARATSPASIGTGLPAGNLCASTLAGDVLTTYTRSSLSGNVTGKVMSTGRADDPTYRVAFGWAPTSSACGTAGECGGYLASKTFQISAGTPGPFKSIDRDRDANTGLIIAARDTAGVQTAYVYDAIGRVTTVTPAGEEATVVDYVSLRETTVAQGTRTTDLDSNADFLLTRYRYDGLGQLLVTEKRPADPTLGFSCEKSQYDIGGHLVYKTESAYATSCTALPTPPQGQCWAFLDSATRTANPGTESDFRLLGTADCDPFGRVQRAIPADGDLTTLQNVIDTHYFGTSSELTVHGVHGPFGVSNDSTVASLHDGLNRLTAVDTVKGGQCTNNGVPTGHPCSSSFPCNTGETCTTNTVDGADAFYEYDAADRLVKVRLTDNLSQEQIRRFGYDTLGHLLWEENPENGTTLYKRYDALGNPLEVQYAKGNARRTIYDFAGRVASVGYALPGSSTFTTTNSFTYDRNDSLSPFGMGKLASRSATELTSTGTTATVISEDLLYNGSPGGRLSQLNNNFTYSSSNLNVSTNYTYTTRGQVATMTYPRKLPTADHDPLTVTYGYKNGMVVCASRGNCSSTDTSWLGKVQYNAAGGVSVVDMPGGGRTEIQTDNRNRPTRITGGKTTDWSNAPYKDGLYKYDASGNIYEIGHATGNPDTYEYDTLNRLIGAHALYAGSAIDDTYTYDIFGNISRHVRQTLGSGMETDDFALGTAVTNRLLNSTTTYDMGSTHTVAASVPFVYDPNGNLLEGGRRINPGVIVTNVKKYSYDPQDRLVNVQQIGDTTTGLSLSALDRFAYDASGNRIWRVSKAEQTMLSVRDASGQVLSEYRLPVSFNTATTREWVGDYVYLAGRLLSMRENLRPRPPSGLSATQVRTPSNCTTNCKYKVTLSWTANSDTDIASYRVYRQLNGGGYVPYLQSTTSTTYADNTQWTIDSVLDYYIIATDQQGNQSLPSPSLRVIAGDVSGPGQPWLTATALDRSVWLSWSGGTDDSGLLGFEICRHLTTTDPCVTINSTLITGSTYQDVNLVNGQPYYYKVRARDANMIWGLYSADVVATPVDSTPPSSPKSVLAASTCGGVTPEAIDVTWEANPPVPPYTLSYEVFRANTPLFTGTGAAPTSLGTTTSLTLRDSGAPAGTTYYYAVKARHMNGATVVTTSPFSAIVSAATRDASTAPNGRLIAIAKDGEVNLRWQPATTPGGASYKVYRKLNAQSSCASYVQVAQGTSAELTVDAGVTDSGVPNNAAFDYSLVQVAANGTESSFGATTLAIPLDRPRGFSQCRMWKDPFCTYMCATPALRVEWSPPDARFYQPYLASTADDTLGFLKGYHLYHHKTCSDYPPPYQGQEYFVDKSPTRPVLASSSDPDPYLLNKDLSSTDTKDKLLDPQWIVGAETQLSSPEGTATETLPWNSCHVAVGGLMIQNACAMPRAVYDIYAEGTWLSRESDWPDYFDPDEPNEWERCEEKLADGFGMVANLVPPTVNSSSGSGGGFTLSNGNKITYWIEERVKDPATDRILERNVTTTQTVTLTGSGSLVKPRITRPSVRNLNATHWALYATATNGTFPTGNEVGEQLIAGTYIDDTRLGTNPGLSEGFPYGATSDVPFCTDIGRPGSIYMRPVRKVTATALGPGSVRIDWIPPVPQSGEPRLAGFYVYGRRNLSHSKQTLKSPLPFATLGPSETSVTINGMNGGNIFDRDVFTVKAFDEAGRVSGDINRCHSSGQDCSATQYCSAQYCSRSGRTCNSSANPTGCGAGFCSVSGAACTSDAICGTAVCQGTSNPCTPVVRARKQVATAATSGASSLTANLPTAPDYGNLVVLTIGVRSSLTTTPIYWVAGAGSDWQLGQRLRQDNNLWVEMWYGHATWGAGQTVTVTFQNGQTPKASMAVAEYSGVPGTASIGAGSMNSATGAAVATAGNSSFSYSPKRLVITGFANVGPATYSNPTNGFVEATDDIATGSGTADVNTVMLEKWLTEDGQYTEVATTLSDPSDYAAVQVLFDSNVSICGGTGPDYEALCVQQGVCLLDTCQTESCDLADGRFCSSDPTLECNSASDCGSAFTAGHCSKTTTQSCNPTTCLPGQSCCPTNEVCVGGASCLSYTDRASINTSGTDPVPAAVRTVLWTLNDSLTQMRGRNGIKLAWTRQSGTAPTGYRVYRATSPDGPFCALLDTGSRTVPLPAGVSLCTSDIAGRTVDQDAVSAEISAGDNALGDRLQSYWDQSAQPDRAYYYRVSTVTTVAPPVESAMSIVVEGKSLAYDPQVPPPPQGLRAWAPQSGLLAEMQSVQLNWCAIPSPTAGSADATGFPTPTEYRVYRKTLQPGPTYQLVARFAPSCLSPGNRCEVTAATDCTNNDPSTCSILTPIANCGQTGQPRCGILDHSFGYWPSDRKENQHYYDYSYFVTAVAGSSPGVESMPSNFNEAWLNYCASAIDFSPMSPCIARRDPDGDGQFLVCGDENSRLDIPELPSIKAPDSPGNETSHLLDVGEAPYRIIGQAPPNPPQRYVYFHLDHLGSPRLVLDEAGNTVSQHHYLAFGEELPAPASPDPTMNRKAFTGQERDSESGLDYMMARYYSSSLGRFMSADPGNDTDLGDPQSWNKYAYVRNNPLRLVDPTGTSADDDQYVCTEPEPEQNMTPADPPPAEADMCSLDDGLDEMFKPVVDLDAIDENPQAPTIHSLTWDDIKTAVQSVGSLFGCVLNHFADTAIGLDEVGPILCPGLEGGKSGDPDPAEAPDGSTSHVPLPKWYQSRKDADPAGPSKPPTGD